MPPSNPGPNWRQLYLTLPLLLALFALDARLKISVRGHQAVRIGIILLVYGLIHLWLKANASALSRMDGEQNYRRITVIRFPVPQLPDEDRARRPIFELPASEIKGVLSDTYHVEYIDAEVLPEEQSNGRVDGARSVPSYQDHR